MTAALKDSGTRSTFVTGAVRDAQEGKGRFDLLPAEALIQIGKNATPLTEGGNWGYDRLVNEATELGYQYLYGDRTPGLLENVVYKLLWAYEEELCPGRAPKVTRGIASLPFAALQKVAIVFELGAKKYAARNWEQGIDTFRYIDSGLRHLHKHLNGETDEPHMAQAIWNFICLLQTELWLTAGKLPQELQTLPSLKPIYETRAAA